MFVDAHSGFRQFVQGVDLFLAQFESFAGLVDIESYVVLIIKLQIEKRPSHEEAFRQWTQRWTQGHVLFLGHQENLPESPHIL
jgi:hypothetical protein